MSNLANKNTGAPGEAEFHLRSGTLQHQLVLCRIWDSLALTSDLTGHPYPGGAGRADEAPRMKERFPFHATVGRQALHCLEPSDAALVFSILLKQIPE